MFRANSQRTGAYNTRGVRQLRGVKWKLQKNPIVGLSPSIMIANGVLYFGSEDGNLYAVDAQTGQQNWKFQIEVELLTELSLQNEVIYTRGGAEGYICAIDINARRLKWKSQIGTSRNSALGFVNNTLYVSKNDGHLYALEQETGQILWVFKTTQNLATTPPAITDEMAYFASKDGNLYAVDAQTGQQNWKLEIGSLGLYSVPAIVNDVVYIEVERSILLAVNATTGQELWRVKIEDIGVKPLITLAITNRVAYTGAIIGYLFAIDTQTQQKIWQKHEPLRYHVRDLVAADEIIYCGCIGAIYALDAQTGHELWEFVPDPQFSILQPKRWFPQIINFYKKKLTGTSFVQFSSPVIDKGIIYTSADDGCVYALH